MAKIDLLTAPIGKTFATYLIPSIIAVVASSAYIFADTAFIGIGVGADGLAALNFAIPIFNFYVAFGLMCGIGGATLLAVAKGKRDVQQQNYWYTLSFIVNLTIGLLISLVTTLFSHEVIQLLGTPPNLLELVQQYLGIIFPFSWLFMINYVFLVMTRNEGKPRLVMIAMVLGSIINIILDWLFVIVWNQGMQGAALATLCSPLLSVSILASYLFSKRATLRLQRIHFRIADIGKLLFSGSATFFMELSAAMVIILFNSVLQNLAGSLAVSAYSIVANLAIMVVAVFSGVAQDLQPLVSTNFGANQYSRSRLVLRYALIITFAIGCCTYIIAYCFPEQLVGIFNTDTPALVPIAKEAIQLYMLAFFVSGMNMIMIAYLQAVQQTKAAFAASILRGLILVIMNLVWLVPLFGVRGVWLTIPVSEIIASVLLGWYVLKQTR